MTLRTVGSLVFVAVAATAAAQTTPPPAAPVDTPNIAGVWVLNPALTQRPDEVGFNRDWARGAGSGGEGGTRSGGGRGRRGGSGGGIGIPLMSRESVEDSTRVQQLTIEARTPPTHLTIVQKPGSVSIADDQGHSRTYHPNGQVDDLTIGTVPLPTTARWDKGSLAVSFDVESGRQLRYTFTPSGSPRQLFVDIRFIEGGREGDEVKLTYESPDEHDRAVLSGAPIVPAAPSAPAAAPPGVPEPPAPGAAARGPVLPPGSELRGLAAIATEVEDLSAPAAACGLDQSKIKTSVTRLLADAGFNTQSYGKEDAYVLVSVATSKLPDGACISRYDASLVAHADANFPYLKGTVAAVEVQLLHEGGMAGGSPSAHASAVMDALTKSVNHFIAQIRAAGK